MHLVETTKIGASELKYFHSIYIIVIHPLRLSLICSISYLTDNGEVCQLLDPQWRKLVSYLTDNGEACQLLDPQRRKFVSYLTHNGGSLSVT